MIVNGEVVEIRHETFHVLHHTKHVHKCLIKLETLKMAFETLEIA